MTIEEQIEREFLAVELRPRNMLIYAPRTSILAAVKRETAAFSGSVLDVGCGYMPYRSIIETNPNVTSYEGLDLEQPTYYANVTPDLTWDGSSIPLGDLTQDSVMATEFLEHYSDPESILREIKRVLKPGGKIFCTVPFIWNLHEVPYDEYRYTPYSLQRHFEAAGFTNIEIKPLGGWNLSMAQMLGLWVTFGGPMNVLRRLVRFAVFPIFAVLVKTDRVPDSFDGHLGSMFPGLSITAEKPSGQ